MERYDIINSLIRKKGFTKYLEVGVRDPSVCFDKIECKYKHSVDPGLDIGNGVNLASYKLTSDDFFLKLKLGELDHDKNHKWDLIFIDGLHLADQVYRDFLNSSEHLSENGVIVFHDANPPTIQHAREIAEDFSTLAGSEWNGTVWKAIQKIRTNPKNMRGDEYSLITVDSDWGVSVLWKGKSKTLFNPEINPFYEYEAFSQNRTDILNLISVSDFKSWINRM